MAGDWIAVRIALKREPEVVQLSVETGRSAHEVVGLLVDFWTWVSNVSADGRIAGATLETLCGVVGGDRAFWEALERVGWLKTGDGLEIPGFDRYLSRRAKRRLREARRKASMRKEEENGKKGERRRHAGAAPEDAEKAENESPSGRATNAQASGPGTSAAGSGDPSSASGVPPELSDLELYRADEKLCRKWSALVDAWKKAYPAIDVLSEVRRAHAWEVANPRFQKRDRARFLGSWLARAQDRARPGVAERLPVNPLGRRSSFAPEGKFSDPKFK